MNEQNYRSFSVREGYEQPKPVQLEGMDDDLRNGLWNVFYHFFPDHIPQFGHGTLHSAFRVVWDAFLKKPTDEYRVWQDDENKVFVKNIFLSSPWNEVFDLIEFVISYLRNTDLNNARSFQENAKNPFIHKCNYVLKRENSAYQIVKDLVVEITSKEEIESIEQAMGAPFAGVRKHIHQALVLLSRRENPDYANSIKESISAVEALAKEVTGNPQGTLGQLRDRLPIQHPAFKEAIGKLYGFSSDAAGIRHGSAGKPLPMDKSTARFMLVICSAFVNYIVSGDLSRK